MLAHCAEEIASALALLDTHGAPATGGFDVLIGEQLVQHCEISRISDGRLFLVHIRALLHFLRWTADHWAGGHHYEDLSGFAVEFAAEQPGPSAAAMQRALSVRLLAPDGQPVPLDAIAVNCQLCLSACCSSGPSAFSVKSMMHTAMDGLHTRELSETNSGTQAAADPGAWALGAEPPLQHGFQPAAPACESMAGYTAVPSIIGDGGRLSVTGMHPMYSIHTALTLATWQSDHSRVGSLTLCHLSAGLPVEPGDCVDLHIAGLPPVCGRHISRSGDQHGLELTLFSSLAAVAQHWPPTARVHARITPGAAPGRSIISLTFSGVAEADLQVQQGCMFSCGNVLSSTIIPLTLDTREMEIILVQPMRML